MKLYLDRRAFLGRLAVAAAAFPLAASARAADRNRVNDLGVRLMCMCGCGQLLVGCNHLNCPKSVPMLKELTAHIDAGETDQQILTHFVEKYGKAVLPAGGAQGILAKVIAFVVVGVGAVVAVFVVKRWKASGARHSASAEPGTGPALDPEYRRRVEEDLKKLTPED